MPRRPFVLFKPTPGPPLPAPPPDVPDPCAFTLPGSGPAALLIHGFADTAAVMYPFARLLHERGLAVRVFTLPGHGRTLLEFAALEAEAMHAAVAAELNRLRGVHGRVVAVGFSMGGLLALRAAADGLADGAATLCCPAFLRGGPAVTRGLERSARALRRRVWAVPRGSSLRDRTLEAYLVQYSHYPLDAVLTFFTLMRATASVLPRIRTPVCIAQATRDDVVSPRSAAAWASGIRAASVDVRYFDNSRHKLVLDEDRTAAADFVAGFARALAGAAASRVV